MRPKLEDISRRTFLTSAQHLLGPLALATLGNRASGALDSGLHFPATAKRVIWLFISGGPSHVDTIDYRPSLERLDGKPIPPSVVNDVHFAMIPQQGGPLLKASPCRFDRHGQSGALVSELLPRIAKTVDDLCIVKSVHSKVFNLDPAVALVNTGDPRVGRPTMGAWLGYGLGTENENLPAYVVMTSGVKVQPLLTAAGRTASCHRDIKAFSFDHRAIP